MPATNGEMIVASGDIPQIQRTRVLVKPAMSPRYGVALTSQTPQKKYWRIIITDHSTRISGDFVHPL